jgi:hypothetical protein
MLANCFYILFGFYAPREDKIDDMKKSFYEELEDVFDKFPDYHTILGGDVNAKVDREKVFKPTTANESLHEIRNDNGVRIVNFPTSKNLSKVQRSHIVTFISLFGNLLMGRLTAKLTTFW